jgi:hypothetical protein
VRAAQYGGSAMRAQRHGRGRGVRLRHALRVSALLPALLLAGEARAVDESFRLSAGWQDLPSYFPPYLANGFVSMLGTARGTETARSYMVAFMDYAPGDMSRPAAVPGWTEIDFCANSSGPGQAWLNRGSFNPQRFRDYHQTLDLHSATLTTSYHYVDRERDTAVEVTTFISQAAPHLAATSLKITPAYDGVVQLSFPLTLWADYAPRFPLAKMTGPEMEAAVAAQGLSLEPQPPATPDRAALWYPGHTQVRLSEVDGATLSMWLDGQAESGSGMALAAAIALPAGVAAQSLTVQRDRYRLSLDVTVRLERGKTYIFTKYVAFSRAGWGGTASDDLVLVREARARGLERLQSEHRAAWETLWQSDILIEGDAKAQQVVHSELYYLLSSVTPDTAWGLGPCGLTTCYAGHAFWDSDTWIFPALLLLHPQRAKSMVAFRERTADAARQRAKERGFAGTMYPWESDPENGTEQTPHSAYVLGETEIHVNADIAIAQWQYYLATYDRDWLKNSGWPVIRDVARFWASRASYDPQEHRYGIVHVNSVAESNTDIANDTFTNVAAARALTIAADAARLIGERPDPLWERIARLLYIPLAADGQHHLAFAPTVVSRGEDFGGGPLSLLFLPSLDLPGEMTLRRNDYAYAIHPNEPARVGLVSMGIAPRTIAAATIGSSAEASAWFAANFTGGTLKAPFNVRTETAANNVGYFMTGSGGYLQSLLYGFSGLRLRDAGLVEAYAPLLPAGWTSLTLRNVAFRGQRLDIRIVRDAAGVARLTRQVH